MRKWCTFFSQTGTEIYKLSKLLNREPDIIVCNKPITAIADINFDLLDTYYNKIHFIQSKPTLEEYEYVIADSDIVTLHGFLRIIPKQICDTYNIYNLHPAPLTEYPDLKGKDPQTRIAQGNYAYYGNTIHKCTAELDSGEVLLEEKFPNPGYDIQQLIGATHEKATNMWFKFLSGISY